MRQCLFSLFKKGSRPLWRKGISRTLPFVGKVYFFVYSSLTPTNSVATEVQGLRIYFNPKSILGFVLRVAGSYEDETTKLFNSLVKDGMTVLDLGANVGYYSLLAGRQVGKKGRVFAFEPWHESFSFLQKNIEANGFKNIIPVAKAVSNSCGRQRLFLASDPGQHSLSQGSYKEFVETDVTTVDEFVREQNISVDLIKMDVEGAEMHVLEGMVETIRNNPGLKIITEFSANNLEKSGCSPSAFLERLVSNGFKLCIINDEKLTRQLINPDNLNELIKSLHRKNPMLINIYCDRNI